MDRSVTIAGFPRHLSTLKLRLFVEKHSGQGTIEVVKRVEEDHVTFIFKDNSGLHKYLNANIKEFVFGSQTHQIGIVNSPGEFSVEQVMEGDSRSQEHETEFTSSSASAKLEELDADVHGTPTLHTSPSPIKPLESNLQEALYKDVQYWDVLPELPAPRGTPCVLAQGIDKPASFQKVKLHFESKRRANGGPISCIINMIDGLVIVFQNEEDCQSCVEKKDQVLEGKPITVFPKVIPEHYEKTLLLEGVGQNTSNDTLEMFLESCSTTEATPIQCDRQEIPGVYIVKYGRDVDTSEIDVILQTVQSKPLEGHDIQSRLLPKTDCLKLTGLKDTITNDQIKLTMQSKKRTGGGLITRIDRTSEGSVLVYFALISDAERVYENSKQADGKITIDKHPVHVQPYHHSLGKDHEKVVNPNEVTNVPSKESDGGELRATTPCKVKPNCSQKLLEFITKSEKHQKIIKDFFKRFAAVEFKYLEEEQCYVVQFASPKENRNITYEAFKKKFLGKFEELLSNNYAVERRAFDMKQLTEARSNDLSLEIQESFTGGENKDLCVRWQKSTIEVVGFKEHVDNTLKKIETVLKNKVVTRPFQEDQFKILFYCGGLDHIRQTNKNVEVTSDPKTFTITFCGPDNDVLPALLDAYQLTGTFKKKKLTGIDNSIITFLTESMQKSTFITETLQSKLKSSNVKATIGFEDDEPYLCAKSSEDHQKAIDVLKKNIVIKSTELDQRKSDATNLMEWDDFTGSLQNPTHFSIYVKKNELITIVGLKSEVEGIRKKVEGYLHENAKQTFFLQTTYGKAQFIVLYSEEFSKSVCATKQLTCSVTPENGGGILLEGKRSPLMRAHQQLTILERSVIEFPLFLNNPGIIEYYDSEEGKSYLDTLQRIHTCVILVKTTNCPSWMQQNGTRPKEIDQQKKGSSVDDFRSKSLVEVTLPSTNVKLSVWKTSITEHRCDVIVNASNEDLILLPSGISGAIKEFDDKNLGRIQKDMKKILDENYGRVSPGEAFLTSAGNLPFCKGIVHAVGPRWHQHRGDQSRLALKSCINKALGEADQAMYKSIAVPAISCGVFGGKVSVCVPIIVEAIEEFFSERRHRALKEVHFVEFSSQEVLDEFTSVLNKYRGASSKPQAAPVTSSPPTNLSVNIIQGDIVLQKADVIVNATDPMNFCKMNKGPVISQLLAKAAGVAVVQECANMKGPFNVGSVHETSGGGLHCKKIYHAIVNQYDPKNSEFVLETVISQCLDRADNANYSSIVFPAIATGGYHHPPSFVAKVMKRVIKSYQPTHLKEVTILLYPGNSQVIMAFDAEFSSKGRGEEEQTEPASILYAFEEHTERQRKTVAFKSTFQQIDDLTGSIGSLVMSICEGDITQMNGDVIVNSTNQSFMLNQGLVSTKILQIGGQQIQVEASKKARQNVDFIVTNAGNLPCKRVLHLVTPSNPEDLHQKIVKLLREVERMKMKSVYMPAFGTGMLRLEVDTIASIMRASIEEFAKNTKLQYLEFVAIVIYDKHHLPKFKNGFFHPEKKKGMLERLVSSFKNLFTYQQPPTSARSKRSHLAEASCQNQEDKDGLQLYIYSTKEEDINQAICDIKKEADRRTMKQVIQDQVINRLTEWERYEIQEITKHHKVKVSQKKDRYLGRQLILEGATNEVLKAHDEVKDVLREFSAAETCATYIIWQWKSSSDQWEDLTLRSNNDLEQAYKSWSPNQQSASNVVQIRWFKDGVVSMEDFDLADTLPTASDPKIKRKLREKHVTDVPEFWSDMKNKQLEYVKLPQTSQEYQNVFTKFKGNSPSPFFQSIVSIQRVQNVQLYKQYIAKKSEVEHKLKNFQGPIERQLFHGTADDDKICQHGFDRGYAGKNATVYGQGVYFAVDPAYSHRYSPPNAQGHKRMFLTDVITGEFCVGNQNIRASPIKPNSSVPNDIYDSAADNANNPQIFVIFKDASAYPSYLITYS